MPIIDDNTTYRFGELRPDKDISQAQFDDSWKGNRPTTVPGSSLKSTDKKIKTFEDLVRYNPIGPSGSPMFAANANITFFKQTVENGERKFEYIDSLTAFAPVQTQGVGDRVEVIESYPYNPNDPKDKQRLARMSARNRQLEDEIQANRADDQAFKTQLLQTVQEGQKTIMGLMDRMLAEREDKVRHEELANRYLADHQRAEREAKEAREMADRAAEEGRLQGLADAEASKTFGLANEVMTAGIQTFGPGLMSLIERIAKKFLDDETPPGAQTAMANDPAPPTTMPGFPAAPGTSQTMKAMNNGNYVQV